MAENKTNGELLKELVELMTPVAEMAKYQIQQINNDIQRNQIITEYLEMKKEEDENNEEEVAELEVVEAEEL